MYDADEGRWTHRQARKSMKQETGKEDGQGQLVKITRTLSMKGCLPWLKMKNCKGIEPSRISH